MQERKSAALLKPLRRVFPYLALAACLSGVLLSARTGMARLLENYARATMHAEPALAAVRLSPADAEAYTARALVADGADEYDVAARAWQEALARRPRDYWLWLELGRAWETEGKLPEALKATQEAIKHAPYYAAPHWQLGNMLLRQERAEEAFAALRRAVASDPALTDMALQLAWQTYHGDPHAVQNALPPATPAASLALARFFTKQGQPLAAHNIFAALGQEARPAQQALLENLLEKGQFINGYRLQAGAQPLGQINDGGFEAQTGATAQRGFHWRSAPSAGFSRTPDSENPKSGNFSARINFTGVSSTAAPVLSQLVAVDAPGRYTLTFAWRTQQLLSGGLPLIAVKTAGPGEPKILAATPVLSAHEPQWATRELAFTVPAGTEAVTVAVQRQNCPAPCPCYGQLWLDDVRLHKAGGP